MNGEKKEYLTFGKADDANNSIYTGITTENDKKDSTIITTDSTGKVSVSGLGDGTYYAVEIQAPKGYSVDATPKEITITAAEKDVTEPWTQTDTKLAGLPATGGIGTTIFTIAGIILMVGAAAIYFARRKRA
jgi:LPXTG-motif cell wall-anchored protein